MEELTIYLCVSPEETARASREGFPLCHMAYRIGDGFRLYRSGFGINVRNGIMLLSDFGLDGSETYSSLLLQDIKRECDSRNYKGIVCDFENGVNDMLIRFLQEAEDYFPDLSIKLYVSAPYATYAPKSQVLVSTAVTGGSFTNSLNEAIEKYSLMRLALFYEPVSVDIIIPSPSDKGERISRERVLELMREYNAISYLSHELSAYYFTYRDRDNNSHFVLYDDERSIPRKLAIAKQAGFRECFLFYGDVKNNSGQIRKLTSQ